MVEKYSPKHHNEYMTEQARIPTGEQQAPQKELFGQASAEIDQPTIISRLRTKNPNDTGEMAQMIIVPIKDAENPTRIIDYHILEVNQLQDIFANTQYNQDNSPIYFGRELQGKKGITFGGDANSIDQGISRTHGYLIQDKEEGKITIHNEGTNGTTLSPLTECAIGETSINARQIVTAPTEGTTITFKGQDYNVNSNGDITSGGQLFSSEVLKDKGLYIQIIDGSLYCKSEVQIKITVSEPPSQQNETQPFIKLPDANASPRETLEQVAQPKEEVPGTITFSEQAALESQQSIPLSDGYLKFRVNSNGMISIIRYDANGNNIDVKAIRISQNFNYAGCRFISDGTNWTVTVEQTTPTQNTSEPANTPEGNTAEPDVEARIPVAEIPRDKNYDIPIELPQPEQTTEPPTDQLTQEPVDQTEPKQLNNIRTKIQQILQEYASGTRTINKPNQQTDEKAEPITSTVFQATEQQDAKVNEPPNFEKLLQEAKELSELYFQTIQPGRDIDLYKPINFLQLADTDDVNSNQFIVVRLSNGIIRINADTLTNADQPLRFINITSNSDIMTIKNAQLNDKTYKVGEVMPVNDQNIQLQPGQTTDMPLKNNSTITTPEGSFTITYRDQEKTWNIGDNILNDDPVELSNNLYVRKIGERIFVANTMSDDNQEKSLNSPVILQLA